ncbi:MAG: tRNA lysidine(34) synthetase TilS [Candidatus Schekmanbacteria bacterium]|nr:tRNA lysidine(34) synthetase TilS [Candidatus Schekmanbacteria bacterium]
MLFSSAVKTIEKYQLIKQDDSIVIAISGGADSVALFHFLAELKSCLNLRLHAAHLNHKLRGKESDNDAEFVRQLAQQHQIPYTLHAENIAVKSKQNKLSLQAAARKYRYRFLRLVAQTQKANKIALAHNAEDQAETMILRLLRGSGPEGLRGIQPQNGLLIRPFLETTRREIEEYLNKQHYVYRTDSSNQETKYLRNKLRHELMPVLLKDYNPRLQTNLKQLADILYEEDLFWRVYTNNQLVMVLLYQDSEHVILDSRVLRTLPAALQRRLCRLAIERLAGHLQAVSFIHIRQILDLVQKDAGEKIIHLPRNIYVIKQYETLEIRQSRPQSAPGGNEYALSVPGISELGDLGLKIEAQIAAVGELAPNFTHKTTPKLCYLDYDQIKEPLLIRTRCLGDRFQPLGMDQDKKLKNFLIDSKVPQSQRDGMPLLVSGGEIVWVIGFRISEKYKVTADSKRILCLKVTDTGNRLYDVLSHRIYPVPNFQI